MATNFYLQGGVPETVMSLTTGLIMVLVVLSVLALPRKYALPSAICGILLIPAGNVLVLGSFHLMPLRIVALAGLLRLVAKKMGGTKVLFAGGLNSMDVVFMAWGVSHALVFLALWQSSAALANQCGFLVSTLGAYLVFRHFIRDETDVQRVIQALVVITLLNAAGMTYEQFAHQNLFSSLGGVPLISGLRDAHIRSQGAFQHPLLAGAYGAVTAPLFVLLWQTFRSRAWAIVGLFSSSIMVFCTWSSTPLFVFLGAAAGLCIWPLRRHMRTVRWGLVLGLLALQLSMKAPVWFLIQRVELGGSSGYHRAILIDNFVRHFSDWYLVGTKTNADWDYETWDTSNEFVVQGEVGGLLTFLLFVALIYCSFQRIGRARKSVEGRKDQEWFFWLLGVALFANVLAFFGVSYWDQIQVAWLSFLAVISTATRAQLSARQRASAVIPQIVDSPDATAFP